MNLHHLKIFHTVAQAGSISLGAERLFVSQPAVTREIRELEAALGVTLFDRLARGVTLTEAGRLLAQFASHIFALEKAAETEIRALIGLATGQLKLGASATLGTYYLPRWLAGLHAAYPLIEVSLLIMNTAQVEAKLDEHEISIGFVEGPRQSVAYEAVQIGLDHIIAVAHPSHPFAIRASLTAQELTEGKLIMREPGSGTRATVEAAYHALGLTIRPALCINSTEAIKHTLLAGNQCVAWLTEHAIQKELETGRLRQLPVSDLAVTRPLHMIWRKGQTLSPSAQAFQTLVLNANLVR